MASQLQILQNTDKQELFHVKPEHSLDDSVKSVVNRGLQMKPDAYLYIKCAYSTNNLTFKATTL